MTRLWCILLFGTVFLVADVSAFGQADEGQQLVWNKNLTLISENTPRFQSQTYSRIRTIISVADGKSVPVEISVRMQSQGMGRAVLTLVRDGAPGDLVLALPDTALSPEGLRDFIIREGAKSDLHYTTIGALRAGDHGRSLSLQHKEIQASTPAILLRRAGRVRLEARLRLRDTAQLGRILVSLGGTSGWTSVRTNTERLLDQLGTPPQS